MKQGFSIIIPTYNTLPYLKLCLKSFQQHSAYSHQLIVCADGSSDGTNEFLETYPGIDKIVLDKNQGICSATNRAARLANREYLFLANDDIVAAPGWDEPLMSQAGSGRVLSGVQIEPGWVPVAPCHIRQDFGRTFGEFREQDFLKYAATEKAIKQGLSEPGVNYPFLIPRELWEKLGGLDERFNPGPGSDPDLFYRLALEGMEFMRVRSSLFYHFGGRASRFAGESASQAGSWKLAAARSRKIYAQKWGRPWGFKFGQVPEVRRPKSLAFFVWGGIGNMVMDLPVIKAAGDFLPGAAVSVMVQRRIMLELLPPSIHKSIVLEDHCYRGPAGWLRLAGELRRMKPEVVLTSLPFPRTRYGLKAMFTGARDRVCPAGSFVPWCNLKIKASHKHYLERNLELLRPAGIDAKYQGYGLSLNPAEERTAEEFLKQQKLEPSKLIGLHPGAGHPRKRWPRENFICLGKNLKEMGFSLLVFGGPEEKELAEQTASGIGSGTPSLAGGRELRPALALIRRCRAFLSSDSGLAHCAAAFSVPTLTVFGPTDPSLSRPYGATAKVVQSQIECAPCYQPSGCFGCSKPRPDCLSQISPERVLAEFEEWWDLLQKPDKDVCPAP